MQRLTQEPGGKLVNKFITDDELSKYADHIIYGPTQMDSQGRVEQPEWIDIVDGKPVVNESRKSQILAAAAAEKTRLANEKVEIENIKSQLRQLIIDIQTATTAAQLRAILEKIVKFLAFVYTR